MTLSLAAVFIPVLFMGGIVGRLLHEFAVTIGVAILVSGFVSITLTPMLCSRFLKPPAAGRHGRFYGALERCSTGRCHGYGASLRLALRHRVVVTLAGVALLVGTAYVFWVIPEGVPARARTGGDHGVRGSRPGDLVRRDEAHQEAVAEIILARSEHAPVLLDRQRHELDRPQQRAREHAPAGAGGPALRNGTIRGTTGSSSGTGGRP